MSTSSTIAILKLDGTIESVYCHSDGYLSYNGIILYLYYTSPEKLKRMMEYGCMSSLAEEIEIPQGVMHNFNNRNEKITIFYCRDRRELNTHNKSIKAKNFNLYLKKGREHFEQYNYLFKEKNKTWYLLNLKTYKLQKLFNLLKKEKIILDSDYRKLFEKQEKEELIKRERKKLNKKLTKTSTKTSIKRQMI